MFVSFLYIAINSQELPEDAVVKRRNASELRLACTKCTLVAGKQKKMT